MNNQQKNIGFVLFFAVIAFGFSTQASPTTQIKSTATSAKSIQTIANPNAPVRGTWQINLQAEPTTLNPLRGQDGYAGAVTGYIFDSLITRDLDSYERIPALAEKFEVSKDGTVFTFTLREGATFHDGKPVTVEDVKFSFDVYFNDDLADVAKRIYFENIDRAEIVDQRTIRFYVKKKYFNNLNVIGGMEILPKHIYGDKKNKMNKKAIGSGSYMLDSYDQGQKIVLKRNPNWWGFKVDQFKGYSNFERISMRFIKEPTAQLESFKKGDLHHVELTADQYVKQTEGAPWGSKVFKEQVENSAPKRTSFVAFNMKRPLFKDVNVRLALSQLYNREFMAEKFFHNKSLPASGPWYQQNPAADPNTKAVKFDPASAKAKLKAAGWADSNKDGVLDKMIDGKQTDFRFTILHPGNEWEKYLTIYKEELKKSGIDVELKQLEWNAFNKALDDRNFDMVSLSWGGVIEQDPKQIWHSGSIENGGSNFAGYSNPEVDKMIDIAREELDDNKRRKLLQKVFAKIAADHPYIFLLNPRYAFYGYSNEMGRVKPTFKYGVGTDTWWLKE